MLETNVEPRERETFFYAPPPAAAVQRTHAVSTVCYEQMHPGVYKVALACWMGFLGVFVVTFFSSANALFMIVIDGVYAVMFFGIPWVFHRIAPQSVVRPRDFFSFLNGSVDTIYGPIRASEALLQVILVPLLLGIGGIAIGFIIQSARMAY
ncbi:MAG: hypothetical protein JSR81_11800 [Proteobacteria bacterium]|nr:hypothetical protein [Pseudomonadota bacterium]